MMKIILLANILIFAVLTIVAGGMCIYLRQKGKSNDSFTRLNGAIFGAIILNFIYLFLFMCIGD